MPGSAEMVSVNITRVLWHDLQAVLTVLTNIAVRTQCHFGDLAADGRVLLFCR
jgi:hypothetical protein